MALGVSTTSVVAAMWLDVLVCQNARAEVVAGVVCAATDSVRELFISTSNALLTTVVALDAMVVRRDVDDAIITANALRWSGLPPLLLVCEDCSSWGWVAVSSSAMALVLLMALALPVAVTVALATISVARKPNRWPHCLTWRLRASMSWRRSCWPQMRQS